MISRVLAGAVFETFAFAYGIICLAFVLFRAVQYGSVLQKPGAAFWEKVDKARTRLYALDQLPSETGFEHAFSELSTGHRLHYIISKHRKPADQQASPKNLAIFLHGWPDSAHLWKDVWSLIPLDAKDSMTLLAVDLPGMGGSESMKTSGPDDVLNALVEFTVEMRMRYLDQDRSTTAQGEGRVFIVAHDWGGVCAFRLAAQAPQLADRFIIANAPFASMALHNIHNRLKPALAVLPTLHLHVFQQNFQPIKDAFAALRPVLDQVLRRSFYVFIFRLPAPFPYFSLSTGNAWFVRYVCKQAVYGLSRSEAQPTSQQAAVAASEGAPAGDEGDDPTAEQLAALLGPNTAALSSSLRDVHDGEEMTYPSSIRGRNIAASTRLYRQGLASRPWTLSPAAQRALARLPQHTASTSPLHDPSVSKTAPEKDRSVAAGLEGTTRRSPPGAARAPVTVVWGLKDSALSAELLLDGMIEGGWLGSGKGQSHIVLLQDVGHWVPCEMTRVGGRGERERIGAEVIAGAVARGVRGREDVAGLKDWLGTSGVEGLERQIMMRST